MVFSWLESHRKKSYSDNVIAVNRGNYSLNSKTELSNAIIFIKNQLNNEEENYFIERHASFGTDKINSDSHYEIVLDDEHYFALKSVDYSNIRKVFKKNGLNFSNICKSYIEDCYKLHYGGLVISANVSSSFKEAWKNYGKKYYDLLSWSNELAKVSNGYSGLYYDEVTDLENVELEIIEDLSEHIYKKLENDYLRYDRSLVKDLSIDDNKKKLYYWDTSPSEWNSYLRGIQMFVYDYVDRGFVHRVQKLVKNNIDFEEGWEQNNVN